MSDLPNIEIYNGKQIKYIFKPQNRRFGLENLYICTFYDFLFSSLEYEFFKEKLMDYYDVDKVSFNVIHKSGTTNLNIEIVIWVKDSVIQTLNKQTK